MSCTAILRGTNIYLRFVELGDVNSTYLRWMNDEETNQYMETRLVEQDICSVRAFVKSHQAKEDEAFFAICEKDGDRHIGNIKLGPIHPVYLHGDVSYFIGQKDCWGKGIATEAVGLAVRYAFLERKLSKVKAGVYAGNIASQKVLEKNGFRREGCLRQEVLTASGREDCYLYGLLRDEYQTMMEEYVWL